MSRTGLVDVGLQVKIITMAGQPGSKLDRAILLVAKIRGQTSRA